MPIYGNQLEQHGWTNNDLIYYNPPSTAPNSAMVMDFPQYDQPIIEGQYQREQYSPRAHPITSTPFQEDDLEKFEQMPYSFDPHLSQTYHYQVRDNIRDQVTASNAADGNESESVNFWKRREPLSVSHSFFPALSLLDPDHLWMSV